MPKIVLILVAALLIAGCGNSLDNSWKNTKDFYGSYLNPPAEIDYSDQGDLTAAEERLVKLMLGVDLQLEALGRYLQNFDGAPSPESVQALFDKFNWLSGFAAIDTEGTVLVTEPPNPIKQLDFIPLLTAVSQSGNSRGIRALVQDNPLGAEVLMAVPIYLDSELKGFTVVFFNFQPLMRYASHPDELVILAPEALLWAGGSTNAEVLQGKDWKAIVSNNVSGQENNFAWISRFIGRQPIIFATPVLGK